MSGEPSWSFICSPVWHRFILFLILRLFRSLILLLFRSLRWIRERKRRRIGREQRKRPCRWGGDDSRRELSFMGCEWKIENTAHPWNRSEKIPWEGEFTFRSDSWAGLIASWGSFYPMTHCLRTNTINPLLTSQESLLKTAGALQGETDPSRPVPFFNEVVFFNQSTPKGMKERCCW